MIAPEALNPFLAVHREDPFPVYQELRQKAPLCFLESLGFWVASRYDVVATVLGDSARFSSAKGIGRGRNEQLLRPTLLTRDPPEHTRLRALVSRAFTPRRVADFESVIQRVVDELLDRRLAAGSFDVVHDLARPLPTRIVAHILGVESERLPDFQRWSDDIFRGVADFVAKEERPLIAQSYREFDAYFEAKIAERRHTQTPDLLGALVAAQDAHGALTSAEIINFCIVVFVAGNETTTNFITNAVKLFLADEPVLATLRQEPALLPTALEEVLRHQSPVQGIFRTTRDEVAFDDITVPANQKVCALIGAANRDPARFTDPEHFDIRRSPNPHIAFGQGAHYCLGAAMARLEARIALRSLLARAPGLRPDPTRPAVRLAAPALVRGMTSFPVCVC